jgi:hypothetical protein
MVMAGHLARVEAESDILRQSEIAAETIGAEARDPQPPAKAKAGRQMLRR